MHAYLQDLRERVATACAELGAKVAQVARRFAVSLSFTNNLLRRQRTTGTVAELPRHPGPAPRLDAAGDQLFLTGLVAQPDATLAELSAALPAAGGPQLGCTAVWRATERFRWGRKKKRTRHCARDPARRRLAASLCRSYSSRRYYALRFCR